MVHETFELVHVVVEHGNEIAGFVCLEVRHLQTLQVGVCVDAQFVLDGLSEVAPLDPEQILEERFEGPDDEGDDRQDDELATRCLHTEARQERFVLAHDDVHGGADQQRGSDVDGLVQERP